MNHSSASVSSAFLIGPGQYFAWLSSLLLGPRANSLQWLLEVLRIGYSAVIVAKKPFSVVFAPIVYGHLDTIGAKYDSLIREKTEEQLTYEPDVETRNRKPVRTPAAFQAEWELRFGPDNRFRVFYPN